MIFKREDLLELLWDDDYEIEGKSAKVVLNEITSVGRWSIYYKMVFSYDGKYFMHKYSRGATEMQDEEPFEYDGDEIDCIEVEPRELLVIKYFPVA